MLRGFTSHIILTVPSISSSTFHVNRRSARLNNANAQPLPTKPPYKAPQSRIVSTMAEYCHPVHSTV